MKKEYFCGSSCVKFILDELSINSSNINPNMTWISELALSLKNNGLNNIRLNCFDSDLYNDFKSSIMDENFDGFKYLRFACKNNIDINEIKLSKEELVSEIDNYKYIILCVESRILNNDPSMSGGHYIILKGRNNDLVNVINPQKSKYNRIKFTLDFIIKLCENYGSWRILIGCD